MARQTAQMRIPGLSMKVRGRGKHGPALASFKVAGLQSTKHELDVDTDVTVHIYGPDGELLVSQYGRCEAVSFKRHRPAKGQPWLERLHSISLGDAVSE